MTKRCIDKCTEALTKHTSPDLVTLVIMLSIQSILVVTYGCESWIIKKSECQIINAFKLWFWRRLLKVPWNARRSNQSILNEINLTSNDGWMVKENMIQEGLMLRLKLQHFGHLAWRADSFEKTLMLGKIEGRRRGGDGDDWMASLTQWTWVWASSRSWWWTGKPGVLQPMGSQRVRHNWVTELNWKWKKSCHLQ